jgi:hypothetical protein
MSRTTTTTGVGLDHEIDKINASLQGISWIDRYYGRIWTIFMAADRKMQKQPVTIENGSDCVLFLKDDTKRAFSGMTFGPEKIINYLPTTTDWERERPFGLLIGMNLSRIHPERRYPAQELLKPEVEARLAKLDNLLLTEYVDDNVELIFKGFDVRGTSAESVTYPYAFMRWNGTLRYGGCYDAHN